MRSSRGPVSEIAVKEAGHASSGELAPIGLSREVGIRATGPGIGVKFDEPFAVVLEVSLERHRVIEWNLRVLLPIMQLHRTSGAGSPRDGEPGLRQGVEDNRARQFVRDATTRKHGVAAAPISQRADTVPIYVEPTRQIVEPGLNGPNRLHVAACP